MHAGNAVNFVITAALCKKLNGRLHLRIDDLDSDRVREEYIEDIFEQLAWLGIQWHTGPQNALEVAQHSQRFRVTRYQAIIDQLRTDRFLYACTCSRSQIRAAGDKAYSALCRNANHSFSENCAWRFKLPDEPVSMRDIQRGIMRVDLNRESGDFVVRRNNGDPAYHIASLVDDIDADMNLIVRGEDLVGASASQLLLARALGKIGDRFAKANFFHHALLKDADGKKLSKSQAASPLRELRRREKNPAWIYEVAARHLGASGATSLAELADSLKFDFSRANE